MTVEKAIEILECNRVVHLGGMHGEILSVSEIIDLLRGISTEEGSVSRQELTITNNKVHLCDSCQYTYVTCPSHGDDAIFGDGKGHDNICACNKYLPICAEPEQKPGKWIPVSERLSEIGKDVLIAFPSNLAVGRYHPDFGWRINSGGNWETEVMRCDEQPLAWMPLPKPYSERRQDE